MENLPSETLINTNQTMSKSEKKKEKEKESVPMTQEVDPEKQKKIKKRKLKQEKVEKIILDPEHKTKINLINKINHNHQEHKLKQIIMHHQIQKNQINIAEETNKKMISIR